MSVYDPRPIKRVRRTKAELEELDYTLFEIVAEIQPATAATSAGGASNP